MFNRFCNIVSGIYRKLYLSHETALSQGQYAIRGQTVQTPATTDKRFVLLARRSKTGVESSADFPEIYRCIQCRDNFVLAWVDVASPLVGLCDRVEDSHPCLRGRDPQQATVFCPVCHTDYAMYGIIPHPDTYAMRAQAPEVYEAHEYPFPPDVPSSPIGCIKFGSLPVEKIVLLVTGEFPPSMGIGDFATSLVFDRVCPSLCTELLVSDQGGIRLHVLTVSAICDESAGLTALIQRVVYKEREWGTRIMLTLTPMRLQPPLKEALFCMVQPQMHSNGSEPPNA